MSAPSNPKTFAELRRYLRADLYRYEGRSGFGQLCRSLLREPGYQFTFWMRLCQYLYGTGWAKLGPYWIARLMVRRYRFKYGIQIEFTTQIGPGFYLCHFGGIVVNRRCVIGKNCNLSHEVTLGGRSRGERAGCPVIGDNVYIGPGAKVIGKIEIGDEAAIGANCVVVNDVPAKGVAVGIPGKVISDKGSQGLVNDVEWE